MMLSPAIQIAKPRVRWMGKCWVFYAIQDGKKIVRWLRRCWSCGKEFWRRGGVDNCDVCLNDFLHQAARAHAKVGAAIRQGLLSRPTLFECVDCGQPATCYDHRDYNKPLEVDPVCRGCNKRRGHAVAAEPESTP